MITTNSYHMTWKLRATVALVLALALSTFPAVFSRAVKAQNPANATAETQTKATASTSAESKGGPKEGIKVHGYWTIDVRSPDGKLAAHREFENSLTLVGANTLTFFLNRQRIPGFWRIQMLAVLGGNVSEFWTLGETGDNTFAAGPGSFKTLTLSPDLTLGGTATAPGAGQITVVGTALGLCTLATPPVCDSLPFTAFTLTTPPCPPNTPCAVNVTAGQIIQVTVHISFS